MTGSPPSLDSVLNIPPGGHGQAGDALQDEDSSAAVLNYLTTQYPSETFKPAINASPGAHGREQTSANGSNPAFTNPRSLSPSDPTVEIDPTIASYASISAANAISTDLSAPSYGYPPMLDNYGTLGEMGGKRKKMPHERAGWMEMEQEGPRKRGRKKAVREDGKGFTGSAEAAGNASGSGGEGQSAEPTPAETKESRADQNRRAQQAFRRRREIRMRDLESAAAALEPLQHRMAEAENKLVDAAVSLEAAQTEIAALKSTLLTIAESSGQSILTPEGGLALTTKHQLKAGQSEPAEIEAAFVNLEKQARELAKANRRKE